MRLATLAALSFILLITAITVGGCSSKSAQADYQNYSLTVRQNTPPEPQPVNAVFLNDSSCSLCQSQDGVINGLKSSGVKFGSVRFVQYDTSEGRELIARHSIKRVPALLISSGIAAYPGIGTRFIQSGVIPAEGYYVLQSPPVYRDLQTGALKGMVNLTFLSDKTCKECFELTPLKTAVARLGLVPASERTVDISSEEGKALAARYSIEKVPTLLLSGEVSIYPRLTSAWPEIGSVEQDGTYALRNTEPFGSGVVYKELATGRIINQTR